MHSQFFVVGCVVDPFWVPGLRSHHFEYFEFEFPSEMISHPTCLAEKKNSETIKEVSQQGRFVRKIRPRSPAENTETL